MTSHSRLLFSLCVCVCVCVWLVELFSTHVWTVAAGRRRYAQRPSVRPSVRPTDRPTDREPRHVRRVFLRVACERVRRFDGEDSASTA